VGCGAVVGVRICPARAPDLRHQGLARLETAHLMQKINGVILRKSAPMRRSFQGLAARSITGFTLLELLISIAVVAVAMAIAVPSFTSIITANQLSATANEIVGALNQARMQAIKRNLPTQFCSNVASQNGSDALGTACGTSTGAVFTIDSSGATTSISNAPQIPPTISLSNGSNVTALRFAGNGLASTALTTSMYSGLIVDIYTTKVKANNHRCIYLITGSVVSSCKITATSGGCPANEPATCQQ